MSMARPGQTPESLAEEMFEQGKITQHDVDEIGKFADFLRIVGTLPPVDKRPVKLSPEWAEYCGLKRKDEGPCPQT